MAKMEYQIHLRLMTSLPDSNKIANKLCEYFSEIGNKFASKFLTQTNHFIAI